MDLLEDSEEVPLELDEDGQLVPDLRLHLRQVGQVGQQALRGHRPQGRHPGQPPLPDQVVPPEEGPPAAALLLHVGERGGVDLGQGAHLKKKQEQYIQRRVATRTSFRFLDRDESSSSFFVGLRDMSSRTNIGANMYYMHMFLNSETFHISHFFFKNEAWWSYMILNTEHLFNTSSRINIGEATIHDP